MKRAWLGVSIAVAATAVVVGVLAIRAPVVEVRPATRGAVAEWIEGTGKARVRERHVVSAPVPGTLQRVAVHAGDRLRAGDVVASMLPLSPTPLDERTRAELEARLSAARAAEDEASAMLRRARVAEADGARALARARVLRAGGSLPASDFDSAEARAQAAAEQVLAGHAAVQRARAEQVAIEAQLGVRRGRPRGEALSLVSPVDGVVLRVAQESPGPVQPGQAIVEVGDPLDVEVALELLTEQASRIGPGHPAELRGWGGDAPLAGVVRRVEPSAFTKVSALGVEEQRVLVLVDPAADRKSWAGLGDGWRVEGRVLAAERAHAITVPPSALVKDGGWAVFVVEDGRARRRDVQVGIVGAERVELLSGVAEGDRVIVDPSTRIVDGARVRVTR